MLPDCPIVDSHHHIGRRDGPSGPREFSGDDVHQNLTDIGFQRSSAGQVDIEERAERGGRHG